MAHKIRFGIDLDGVLADFGSQVVKVANKLWPGKMPADYVPINWDYTDVFSKEDWKAVWTEIKATPYFWYDEKPYLENVRALQGLESPADIYFITSRAETTGNSVLVQSSRWLMNFGLFPLDGHSTVIPVADPKHKATLIQALQLPFMLDDYAVTVDGLQTLEGTKTYLLDQPWNRHAAHLPRVFSIKEYLDIVVKG